MSDAFNEHGQQIVWDATSLTQYQECPRKYYYKILKGYQPKQKSIHLVFGGLIADACENFYRRFFETQDFTGSLRLTIRELLTHSKAESVFLTEQHKTREALVRTFIWYIDEFFPVDSKDILIDRDGKPVLERSFVVDVGPFMLSGRMDRVIERQDSLYIVDQKTTKSAVGPWYFRTYTPNNQVSNYLTCGDVVFDRPVKAMFIDAMQIEPKKSSFVRGVINRTKAQKEEWLTGIIKMFEQHLQLDPSSEQDWIQNPNACGYYSGCEFREVCSKSPKARSAYLKQGFTVTPWDPLRGKRKGEEDETA